MTATKPARRTRRAVGRPKAAAVGEEPIVTATIELLKTVHPARLNGLKIAQAARVDPSLIRYYFGDMEHLLQRTALHIVERLIDGMTTVTVPQCRAVSPPDALRVFARNFFQAVTRYPHYHQLILQQIFSARSKEARLLRKRLQTTGQDLLHEIFERGIADGSLHDVDTRFLEVAVIGMCESMITSWPLIEDLFDPQVDKNDVASAYSEFIAEMLVAHARGRRTVRKAVDTT